MDDGSTDGTAEVVRAEFPSVHLERSETSTGYIVQRNRAARLAGGDIIFSIDDDAEFSNPNVIEQTLRDFSDPRIGAVAIPYVEPRKDNQLRQSAPDASDAWVTDAYIGTAHALRRDVFLSLGGYREQLVHQGEERDYCLRMLEEGMVVRLGNSKPILHHESPRRDFSRMDFHGRRNDILFVWQNVPSFYLPSHLLGTTLNGISSAVRAGRYRKMLQGIVSGYGGCFNRKNERRPVSPEIYRLHRSLKRHGPQLLQDMGQQLPPLSSDL